MEDLKIEGLKDYPIKWVCNFRGQRAIGICGYSQKIAMFAADERVSKILDVKKKTDAVTLNVNIAK